MKKGQNSLTAKIIAAAATILIVFLLIAILPGLVRRMKPVQKSSISNGICMEVVSAVMDADTAKIRIAIKDLEGDRVDETIDLFDSYYIKDDYDTAGTCRLERFDEETKTAYLCLCLEQMDRKKFETDKVIFGRKAP